LFGVPPGTADLLIKFVPPETLERFGGASRYARAIDNSLTRLGVLLRQPAAVTELLLGEGQNRRGDGDQAVDHALGRRTR
jgi:hypothetical protein